MSEEKPKGYRIKKRIDRPARVIGLYYNTFFVFIILAAIFFMAGASNGWVGLLISGVVILGCYFGLFYVQTKIGPREFKKMVNNYQNPIDYIKMDKSIRRLKK